MTIDYDQEFGPNGRYPWPGCIDIAEGLIKVAPCEKSSSDCLTEELLDWYLDNFEEELLEYYPEEEASELKEAAVRERQELFKDARGWPLPCLVTSAVYYIFSTDAGRVYIISKDLLWLFLSFNKPLFDMLRSKGWGKAYQDELRKGFRRILRFEIDNLKIDSLKIDSLRDHRLLWGSDTEKERQWFMCEGLTLHTYPEDVIRCLDLIGIDKTLARWAVDEMFKLQSLTPFLAVLSDNP